MKAGHKNHPDCQWTSKAACDKAARIAMGQCAQMISEDKPCPHWGLDKVDDKPYCGQHLTAVFLAADKAKRETARKDEIAARVDAFMAWTARYPSVHERMPVGWQP